MLSYDNI
ncbi:unnamed protein product, partial [Rotaria sp. Silwood1]